MIDIFFDTLAVLFFDWRTWYALGAGSSIAAFTKASTTAKTPESAVGKAFVCLAVVVLIVFWPFFLCCVLISKVME